MLVRMKPRCDMNSKMQSKMIIAIKMGFWYHNMVIGYDLLIQLHAYDYGVYWCLN